jgi:phosphate transport system substrate-binding protein
MHRVAFLLAAGMLAAACAPAAGAPLDGMVALDGSSTVYPISEAVGEEFQKANPKTRVTIGIAGTGGGFKRFCSDEIDIANASRPIKQSEIDACAAKKVDYIELPIAYDGLAVMVNPKNDWATCMTVAELKTLWSPEAQGKVTKWSQVRPGWPDKDMHLFGAGVDSGTYDYFTEAVVGKQHSSRGDFQSSEDDNVLVQGIANDPLALGFFGLAYYGENKDKLKLVGIDDGNPSNGAGCVQPSNETVERGTYQPLARPLFIYVKKSKADDPVVKAFVEAYLEDAPTLVKEVGHIPFGADAYKLVKQRFDQRKTGTLFASAPQVGITITELLAREKGA